MKFGLLVGMLIGVFSGSHRPLGDHARASFEFRPSVGTLHSFRKEFRAYASGKSEASDKFSVLVDEKWLLSKKFKSYKDGFIADELYFKSATFEELTVLYKRKVPSDFLKEMIEGNADRHRPNVSVETLNALGMRGIMKYYKLKPSHDQTHRIPTAIVTVFLTDNVGLFVIDYTATGTTFTSPTRIRAMLDSVRLGD